MDVKTILTRIGLGAAAAGGVAATVATGGAAGPLVTPLIAAISNKIDPTAKDQFNLAVQAASADLAKTELDYSSKIIVAVNETMQAEAKSDSWLQKSWRPLFGLGALLVIINNYALLPYFARVGLKPVEIPGDVWNVMLAVLGVAAMTRGVEKIAGKWPTPSGNGGDAP